MPAVARSDSTDNVMSPDGSGYKCRSPMQTKTDEGNGKNVFANGITIVVIGNKVKPHPLSGCSTDESTLSSSSNTVFIGGKGVGRIGDQYGNNVISSGSTNVFVGG